MAPLARPGRPARPGDEAGPPRQRQGQRPGRRHHRRRRVGALPGPGPRPAPGTAPVRLGILDVGEDGAFDEKDVGICLGRFYDASGAPKEADDCGRFDLNGDCFTGGSHPERPDLDRIGSAQYGETSCSRVSLKLGTPLAEFDEERLTDAQVLCCHAHSGPFTGDASRRSELLRDRCAEPTGGLTGELTLPSTLPGGGFSTGIGHDGTSTAVDVTVTLTDGDGRQATRSARATIVSGSASLRVGAGAGRVRPPCGDPLRSSVHLDLDPGRGPRRRWEGRERGEASLENAATLTGLRVLRGLPFEGGAPVMGFRFWAESGHAYGFGHP